MSNKLPSDYQEVEYIESTGTQYIDTGIIPNNTINIDMNLKVTNSINSVILGSDENWQINNFVIYINSNQFALGFGELGSNAKTVFNVNELYKLTLKNKELYINDEIGVSYKIHQVQVSDCKNNISLFALNRNKTIRENSFIKLYSLKIYDNDVLIRNFIPCYRKSDNEIGLYDIANNTFYTNQGTGVFLKGQNVYSTVADKLDYLIETKQQIKDALDSPNNTMRKYPPLIKKYVDNQPADITINGVCKDALEVPLVRLGVDGNSEQNGYEGYNFYDKRLARVSSNASQNIETTPFPIKENTTYTFYAKGQDWLEVIFYDENNNMIDKKNNGQHIYIMTFTTSENTKTIKLTFYAEPNVDLSTYDFTNVMLLEGTYTVDTLPPYEPYTGGQPSPNPNYEQEIEVIDTVNKANKDVLIHYDIEQSIEMGTRLSNNDNPILIKSGDYELNCVCTDYNDSRGQVFVYDKNMIQKSFIDWSTFPISFTLNEDSYIKYAIVKNFDGSVNIDRDDIELLSILPKNTPYLPYGCIGLLQQGKNFLGKDFDFSKSPNEYGWQATIGNEYITSVFENNMLELVTRTSVTGGSLMYFLNSIQSIRKKGFRRNKTYTFSVEVKGTLNDNDINDSFNEIALIYNQTTLATDGWYKNGAVKRFKKYTNILNSTEWHRISCTITLPDNDDEMYLFIRFSCNGGTVYFRNVQIEESSITTPYEPYHSPKIYPINLNGNTLARVGDIKDLLKIYRNGDVEIEKNTIPYRVLANDSTIIQNDLKRIIINNFREIEPNPDSYYLYPLICDRAINEIAVGTETKSGIALYYGRIHWRDDMFENMTLEEAKQWLIDNETNIITKNLYPQTIKLPSIDPIELWEGTNKFDLITNLETDYTIEYNKEISSVSDEWKPNPDWYDIDTILEEDNEDYVGKIICLIDNRNKNTSIFTFKADKIVTSDGATYDNPTSTINHVWDISYDKSFTRYIIYYFSTREVQGNNNTLYVPAETIYCIFKNMYIYNTTNDWQSAPFFNRYSLQAVKCIDCLFEYTPSFSNCYSLKYIKGIKFNQLRTTRLFLSTKLEGKYINEMLKGYQPTDLGYFLYGNSVVTDVDIDTSKVITFANSFQQTIIKNFNSLDCESATDTTIRPFYSNMCLCNINEVKNIKNNINLSDGAGFNYDTLLRILNALYDYSSTGDTYTLTLENTNLAKLTAEEISIATNKGWTVS